MASNLFPKDIRRQREALGLTQTQMAEKLSTPFRTYQDWESGRVPAPGILDLALEALTDNAEPVREDYCWVAGHRKRPTRGWVLQDTRHQGRVAVFWAHGEGYTTDLRKAAVFTREQADARHQQRASDVPRSLKHLVVNAQACVACEDLAAPVSRS